MNIPDDLDSNEKNFSSPKTHIEPALGVLNHESVRSHAFNSWIFSAFALAFLCLRFPSDRNESFCFIIFKSKMKYKNVEHEKKKFDGRRLCLPGWFNFNWDICISEWIMFSYLERIFVTLMININALFSRVSEMYTLPPTKQMLSIFRIYCPNVVIHWSA